MLNPCRQLLDNGLSGAGAGKFINRDSGSAQGFWYLPELDVGTIETTKAKCAHPGYTIPWNRGWRPTLSSVSWRIACK